ncbi:hypothetical protein GCM10009613_64040 [Pseudonocardia kongjuensis]|uniref:DUF1345 domain-containing protein n=1 Tax=Pseudonocardia kongjuensis TaxID=102227 RepID=A0ABN1YBJ7_9PSEU
MSARLSLITSRVIEFALVLLGVAVFIDENLAILLLWDLLAVLYLTIRVRRLVRSARDRGGTDGGWLRSALGGRSGFLLTTITSLAGITAGLMIVIGDPDPDLELAGQLAAVPAVLLAWAILHFGYAERYARDYYAALPERILVFPGTDRPTLVDFAYFSFGVGTSFNVSDVQTNGSAVRFRLLAHSVLAFLYNAAILAIAIGVINDR